ncbi:MAG: right-handed parallel beta-helix repeat-containing protein [Thermoplasmata archaeon]|nr:right-handed parallel beta-helix repeat-containing protein [Thermoplasmata archaeon]
MSHGTSNRKSAQLRRGVRDYHTGPVTRSVGVDDGTGLRHPSSSGGAIASRRAPVFGLALVLIVSSAFVGFASLDLDSAVSSPSRSLTTHSPIRIDSDAGFAAQGWPGDGSISDPYIIGDLEIDAAGYRNGIYVGNTSVHFRIQGCSVTTATDAGIHLLRVRNGIVTTSSSSLCDWYCMAVLECQDTRVDNCTLVDGEDGAYVVDCENMTIADTHCTTMAGAGMHMSSSVGCSFIRNLCTDNEDQGILIESSPWTNLTENLCSGSVHGIRLIESSHNCTSVADSATENLLTGFAVESSDSISIERGTFTGNGGWFTSSSGITLLWSNNSRLTNDNCSSNVQGISLDRCRNCTVDRASCFFNVGFGAMMSYTPGYGVRANLCNDMLVMNSTISRHGGIGLDLLNCNRVCVDNSTMSNGVLYGGSIKRDSYGMSMSGGGNISVVRCNCSNNDWWGITIWSPDTLVSQCNVSGNQYDGIRIGGTRTCRVDNCTAINNGVDTHITKLDAGTYVVDCRFGMTKLESARYVTMKNNSHIGLGLVVSGTVLAWDSHTIDDTNTVRGKPIAYLAGESGLTVPAGAGQVILASCSDVSVANQFLSDVAIGLQIGYSKDIDVRDCEFARDLTGVYMQDTNSSTVNGSLFWTNSDYGIRLVTCHGNFIWNNSFFGTSVLASTSDADNYWNITGYGNFWEDWQSPDLNFDGIVDNPRPVPTGTYDYYPLTYSPTTVPEFSVTMLVLAIAGMLVILMGLRRGRHRAFRVD